MIDPTLSAHPFVASLGNDEVVPSIPLSKLPLSRMHQIYTFMHSFLPLNVALHFFTTPFNTNNLSNLLSV